MAAKAAGIARLAQAQREKASSLASGVLDLFWRIGAFLIVAALPVRAAHRLRFPAEAFSKL
jgi:hypothetical protein